MTNKNYTKKNIENNIEKNQKIKNIEKMFKKNILENELNEKDRKSETFYQNSLNNIKTENNYFDLTNNHLNKKIFTPNRFIQKNKNEIYSRKKCFSPNNINTNENNKKSNINNKIKNYDNLNIKEINNYALINKESKKSKYLKSLGEEKDYDYLILQNQLKDMEKQINLLNNISIYKKNYSNNNNIKNRNYKNFEFKNTNFFKGYSDMNNYTSLNINKNQNYKISPFRNYYNNNFSKSSNNNKQNNYFLENSYPRNYNCNEKSENNSFSQDKVNNKYENNQIQEYALKDLKSNNSLDLNMRMHNLEKCIFDIKKELSSMSSILSNLSSNNFFINKFKEQIKQVCNDFLYEKMNLDEDNKYRKVCNDCRDKNNHSFYNEFLKEEDKQKNIYENNNKFENEINNIIEQKLENLGEKIKIQINNNLLKPYINKLENDMKENIDKIKKQINNMNKNNDFEYLNNNKNEYSKRKNQLFESNKSDNEFLALNKGSSELRNQKYEEINKLGEKLYQKLVEKEKKLKLLKRETLKYLGEYKIGKI